MVSTWQKPTSFPYFSFIFLVATKLSLTFPFTAKHKITLSLSLSPSSKKKVALSQFINGEQAKIRCHASRRGGSEHVHVILQCRQLSLSQLYTQAMNHQRLSFQAGERHALDKLYQWILRQQGEGARVTIVDVVAYLQNELEHAAEEAPASPRLPLQHQHSQSGPLLNNTGVPVSCNPFAAAMIGQGVRSLHSDQQAKNSVFSNALSSPVRRSLQDYQLGQGGYHLNNFMSSGNVARTNEMNYVNHQNRDVKSPCSNDTMDMHAESPSHEFPY